MGALQSILGATGAAAGVNIVISAVDNYSAEFKKVKAETTQLDKNVGSLSSTMSKLATPALIAAGTAAAAFAVSAVKAASSAQPIRQAFQSLAEDSDNFLRSLTSSTEGMISNVDLMLASNKALLLGLKESDLPGYFRQALILGEAVGIEGTQSIENLTRGIATQNERMLKSLGVQIDFNTALDKFAEANNRSTESITEAERALIFEAEAVKSVNDRVKELGDSVGTGFGDQLKKFQAGVDNLKVSLGDLLIKGLQPVVEDTNMWFQVIKFGLKDLAEFKTEIGLTTEQNDMLSESAANTAMIMLGPLGIATKGLTEGYQYLRDWAKGYTESKKEMNIATEEGTKKFNAETTAIKSTTTALEEKNKALYDSMKLQGFVNIGGKGGVSVQRGTGLESGQVTRHDDGSVTIRSGKTSRTIYNDFISRPGAPMMPFSPDDTIIGVKQPEKLMGGGGITVNIGTVSGVDADAIAEALQEKLRGLVSAYT